MKLNEETWGCIAVIISGAIMAFFVYMVFSVARAHHERPQTTFPIWEPPDIEQCDKELWDRIRYECEK